MADAQLAREITNISNTLAAAYQTYTTYINNLATLYGRVTGGRLTREEVAQDRTRINEIFTRLAQYNRYFGAVVNKFNKQTGPQIAAQLGATTTKAQELTRDLIKLADAYDERGKPAFATEIDEFISKTAELDERIVKSFMLHMVKDFILHDVFGYFTQTTHAREIKSQLVTNLIKLADFSDEVGAYVLADELDKIAEEVVEPIQQPQEGSLSTRYCPDHDGVQAIRISERIYQCPLDGKVYNYETGYTNYKGQQVPGGSIAAQTPTTSDFGGIPMRIYDSRQTVLNRVY